MWKEQFTGDEADNLVETTHGRATWKADVPNDKYGLWQVFYIVPSGMDDCKAQHIIILSAWDHLTARHTTYQMEIS